MTGRVVHRVRGADGGASSLAMALLCPVFVVLAFAGFQAALWSHARTEARVIARDTAGLIARAGFEDGVAGSLARALLDSDTDIDDGRVIIGGGPDLVVVTITGRAPGIIRGTSAPIEVTVAIPREGWRS